MALTSYTTSQVNCPINGVWPAQLSYLVDPLVGMEVFHSRDSFRLAAGFRHEATIHNWPCFSCYLGAIYDFHLFLLHHSAWYGPLFFCRCLKFSLSKTSAFCHTLTCNCRHLNLSNIPRLLYISQIGTDLSTPSLISLQIWWHCHYQAFLQEPYLDCMSS